MLTVNHTSNITISNDVQSIKMVKIIMYSLIFAIGVLGNILVAIVTATFSVLRRKPTNIYICNLCVCDVLILLLGIPLFAVGEGSIGSFLKATDCKLLQPFLIILLSATVFTLVGIALERYFAIVKPFYASRKTLSATYIKVFFVNLLSVFTGIPLILALQRRNRQCALSWSISIYMTYWFVLFLIQYLLPLIVMCYLYLNSWHKIRNKNQKTVKLLNNKKYISRSRSATEILTPNHQENKNGIQEALRLTSSTGSLVTPTQENNNHLSSVIVTRSWSDYSVTSASSVKSIKSCDSFSSLGSFRRSATRLQHSLTNVITGANVEEYNANIFSTTRYKQTVITLKMFMYILLVFLICMLPHQISEIMAALRIEIKSNLSDILHIFIYINAAINPWLYGGLNKQFRKVYYKHLRCTAERSLLRFFVVESESMPFLRQQRSPCCWKLISCCKKAITDEQETVVTGEGSGSSVNRKLLRSLKESKTGCKDVLVSDDIPTSAPIIIITCYDDEIEARNIFL